MHSITAENTSVETSQEHFTLEHKTQMNILTVKKNVFFYWGLYKYTCYTMEELLLLFKQTIPFCFANNVHHLLPTASLNARPQKRLYRTQIIQHEYGCHFLTQQLIESQSPIHRYQALILLFKSGHRSPISTTTHTRRISHQDPQIVILRTRTEESASGVKPQPANILTRGLAPLPTHNHPLALYDDLRHRH